MKVSKRRLLVFLLLMLSDDALIGNTVPNRSLYLGRLVLYGYMSLKLLFATQDKLPWVPRYILPLGAVAASLAVTISVNADASLGYLYQFLIITVAVATAQRFNATEYLESISSVVLIASIGALGLYVAVVTVPSLLNVLPRVTNSANTTAVTIGIASIFVDTGFVRTMGPFREAGVFGMYLCLAIMNELLLRAQIRSARLAVLLCALITSASTTAVIAVLLLLVAYVGTKASGIRSRVRNLFVVSVIIGLGIGITDANYGARVFGKLSQAEGAANGSALARVASLYVGALVAREEPLWGVGLRDFPKIFGAKTLSQYGIELDANGILSSTFGAALGTYGAVAFLLLAYSIFMTAKRVGRGIVARYASLAVLAIILSSQDLRYSVGMMTLLIIGVQQKRPVHELKRIEPSPE